MPPSVRIYKFPTRAVTFVVDAVDVEIVPPEGPLLSTNKDRSIRSYRFQRGSGICRQRYNLVCPGIATGAWLAVLTVTCTVSLSVAPAQATVS